MALRFSSAMLVVLWVYSGVSPVEAEVFVLANGGRIEGEVLPTAPARNGEYLLQPAAGTRLLLSKEFVEEVLTRSEAELWYDKWLPRMPPTVDGNLKMAEECQKRGLDSQREVHLQEVIRLEPDHEGARQALGYSRSDGRWVRMEDVMTARGFIQHEGRWKLPQEVALASASEARSQAEGEWRRKVRLYRNWLIRGRERVMEGEMRMREIRDPDAAVVLIELLQDAKEPVPLKLLYVDVLAQLPPAVCLPALARASMEDADAKVRERCLDQLVKLPHAAAIPYYTRFLTNDNNRLVNRAAAALGRLNAQDATLPLIDALVTKHRQLLPQAPAMSAGFDKNGGGGGLGFQTGGSPKFIDLEVKNDAVLAALTSLHTSTNFGYSEDNWKRWYLQQKTPRETDLRRGD